MRSTLVRLASMVLALLAAAPEAGAQKIGFLDFETVVREYSKTQEITEDLSKRIEAFREQLAIKMDELRQREEALDAEDPTSLDYLHERRQLTLEKIKLEEDYKSRIRVNQSRLVEHLKQVYKDARIAVESLARERGLDAVFLYTSRPVEGSSEQEVKAEILTRPVIYQRGEELDLTREVIDVLNNQDRGK